MINVTTNVIFNATPIELHIQVRQALEKSATALTEIYGAQSVNLNLVTTKTKLKLAYVKFVRLTILAKENANFDEEYVNRAYKAYSMPRGGMGEVDFYKLTFACATGPHRFKPSYAPTIQLGMGVMLVTLHSSGAITLPYSFNWPFTKGPSRNFLEVGHLIGSELLMFVRSASLAKDAYDPALTPILTDRRRRKWFVSSGTKLLLATGWNTPNDINLDDLLAIKYSLDDARPVGKTSTGMAYRVLVEILARKYRTAIAISVQAWDEALSSDDHLSHLAQRRLGAQREYGTTTAAFNVRAQDATTPRMLKLDSLPGLDVDYRELSKIWLQLESIYLKKIRLENKKAHISATAIWNIYLFFYLPYWFTTQPACKFAFPTTPEKLLSGIFVSKLAPSDFEVPLAFIEFFRGYADKREWSNQTRYAELLAIWQFFAFLEQNSKELPGCRKFIQPLSKFDFPPTTQSGGTNKRPIPRRIFAFHLAYMESLLAYLYVVTEKILAEEITENEITFFLPKRSVLDTARLAETVGYVPIVYFEGKLLRLQFIPNCLNLDSFRLKDGRTLRIPQPHGLHHTLIASYTGIRNNHIQWLDSRTFDSKVNPDDVEFSMLWVNTDKVKNKGWAPHVNFRVIQLLRNQLRWRDRLDWEGIPRAVHYQKNRDSKWPPIVPIFACEDGFPHPDSRYSQTWKSVLMGMQGMMRELGVKGQAPLLELLPSDVPLDASDRSSRLRVYQNITERKVEFEVKSNITPHSARVGIVSNLIHVLPAEVIGKYVTGQQQAVVYHYVYIDENEMLATQELQAKNLQLKALRREFDSLITGPLDFSQPQFIKADEVNSRFSQSLSQNMEETIVTYGCISVRLTERDKTGIDVLRETRGASAAFNKTEVCPFGNQCPPDVVKTLRGFGRCSMCHYAVRSIDHLPAVIAKTNQTAEFLEAIELKLDAEELNRQYGESERSQLEAERQRIADELVAWKLVGEILETQRQRIAAGNESKRWIVPKPEVIEQALRRVAVPSTESAYVLTRLAESVAYPTFDSPEITARFDLLRRQLLANVGNVREALTSRPSPAVAAQCLGLLKTVIEAHNLTYEQVLETISSNIHLSSLPSQNGRLLLKES